MLLNVISLNLYNDPKSWNDHFPLHILSLTFPVLSVPRRWTFCGLYHRLPLLPFYPRVWPMGDSRRIEVGRVRRQRNIFLGPLHAGPGVNTICVSPERPSSCFVALPSNYSYGSPSKIIVLSPVPSDLGVVRAACSAPSPSTSVSFGFSEP